MTGLPDYNPRALCSHERLYTVALSALDRRREWSAKEHARFFEALLPVWPLAGRPPTGDGLSKAAALLARAGRSKEEIHEDLYLPPAKHGRDAIRQRDDRRRPRPSIERGERLLACEEEESVGTRLRRQLGTVADPPELLLPAVYLEGDPEPEGTFNPLIDLRAVGLGEAGGDHYLRLASERLRELWLDEKPLRRHMHFVRGHDRC